MLLTDTLGAAGYLNAAGHLAGPLRSGAVDAAVPVAADGSVQVDWTTREPLIVATLRADLGAQRLIVTATLPDGTAGRVLPPAEFAAWTPAGASLPLVVPEVDKAARTAGQFALQLAMQSIAGDNPPLAVAPGDIAGQLDVHVLEGLAGRVAFLLLAEKTCLRRTQRVIAACGLVQQATGDALDRIGAELGLPRFPDRLTYDAVGKTIVAQTLPGGEPDAAYARRLTAFRPFVLPNAAGIAARLNAGGVGGVSFAENAASFPVAMRVVSIGADLAATNFFNHVYDTYLVLLDQTPDADTIVHARFMSPDRKAAVDAQRQRLAAGFVLPALAAVAPFLADALDLICACRQTLLGSATPAKLTLSRAFDRTAGSRYELGLGADITLPPSAESDALVAAVNANPTIADPRVAAAVEAMHVALAAGTPDTTLRWFWQACGLRTVEAIDAATVFVSTTAVGPLTIEGPSTGVADATTLTAVRRAVDDPNVDAILSRAAAAAATAWIAAGHAAWTVLSAADAATAWNAAVARTVSDPVGEVIAGAGLPAVTTPDFTAKQLALMPAAMLVTVKLAAADCGLILAHDPAAILALRSLAAIARTAGVTSMLVLTTATDAFVVFGAYGLPGAGLNVGERGATAIRWSVVPLAGAPMTRAASGGTCKLSGSPALAIAVAVSGARGGAHDPYEAGVELPAGTLLDLDGYELAMNVLAHACPIGVRVNTWDLRQAHVDLDGDGSADPLSPQFAATYRAYRRRRYVGEGPPNPAN